MSENVTKEVVKGDSENFIKKAKAVDKKPVSKKPNKINKTNKPHTNNEKPDNAKDATNGKPIVKKPLTRAQIAEKKFGVESTWRPFEAFFNNKK